MSPFTKAIVYFAQDAVLACDGNCAKAWGTQCRPRERLDPADPDDYAFHHDGELGDAPDDPGTYEGGHAKPTGPDSMNKWCVRQCERSEMKRPGDAHVLPDFSRRVFNQPWKHKK